MLLKALDLLRTLGWSIVQFIFGLIDSLFEILKGLNSYDIINSVSDNKNFVLFQKGVIVIAITLLGLFAITRFTKKVIDPDDSLSTEAIVKEIIKSTLLIVMSTFLFVQASTFSIKLAGYTANIFGTNSPSLSNSMLNMYVDYTDGYKDSDDFKKENISQNIENKNFHLKKMYNDKYVTSSRWILPDEQDYKYQIDWILAIIIGGFFLYSLFFSGMMLARRQIEFLFLFIISPIVYATSVGNKERRQAVIQQLISLMLQGAVIMLIISLTAIVMGQINDTTFFDNTFKDIVIKSVMYIGCGSFLLTGSQVVNRFIGGNVSANSGRDQLMAMMGFGQGMGAIAATGTLGAVGAGLIGAGAIVKGTAQAGDVGNSAMGKVGRAVSNFGSKISKGESGGIGGTLKTVGDYMQNASNSRKPTIDKTGKPTQNKLSKFGSEMMDIGASSMYSAADNITPSRHRYRRRYRGKGD